MFLAAMNAFPVSTRRLFGGGAILALSLVVPLLSPSQAAKAGQISFVSPEQAAAGASSGQWKVLDMRPIPPLDYFNAHLPKAVHLSEQAFRGPNGKLPIQIWPATDLANLLSKAGISNTDKVLVYSDANNVLGASLVAYILEKSGVPTIGILDGVFTGYKGQGQPVTKVFPTYKPGVFNPKTVPGLAISLKDVLALASKPNVVIVDPRPKALFEGTDQTFIRNGHIPGAINITWQSVTEANNAEEALKNPHKLKSIEALRQLFVSRGVTPDKMVIISCTTGREASLQYVVLKHVLGYPKVRLYEGSWNEYSTTDNPVQTGPETPLKN